MRLRKIISPNFPVSRVGIWPGLEFKPWDPQDPELSRQPALLPWLWRGQEGTARRQ